MESNVSDFLLLNKKVMLNELQDLKKTIQSLRENKEEILNMINQLENRNKNGKNNDLKKIYAVGCGDSYFVANWLEILLNYMLSESIEARSFESLEFIRHVMTSDISLDDVLVILISASGKTRRTLEAAMISIKKGAKTIAITNDRESSLARGCHASLTTSSDNAFVSPTTTTFTAAWTGWYLVLMLHMMLVDGIELENDGLIQLVLSPRQFYDFLTRIDKLLKKRANDVVKFLEGKKIIHVVGSGTGHVIANLFFAKLRELCDKISIPVLLEELYHYTLIPLTNEHPVVLVNDGWNASQKIIKNVAKKLKEIDVPVIELSVEDLFQELPYKTSSSIEKRLGDNLAMFLLRFLLLLRLVHHVQIDLATRDNPLVAGFSHGSLLGRLIGEKWFHFDDNT